MFIDIVSD